MTNRPTPKTPAIIAAAIIAALAGTAAAQDAPTLRLQTGQVDVAALPNALTANQVRPQRMPDRMVMVTDAPMTPQRRQQITATGARIGDYLPENAYIVNLRNADINAIKALNFVTHLVEYQDAWKIDPLIGNRTLETDERKALSAAGKVASQVYLFPGEQIQAALAQLAAQPGIEVVRHELIDGRFMVEVTGSAAQIRGLAKLDAIQWIESAPEITMRNSTNRWIVQSNTNGYFPVYEAGIRGENQLVAVMDGRVDINHCSFRDPDGNPIGDNHRKIQAYNTSTSFPSFHGTHVAGTVLGDNNQNNHTRGVAYEARLVFDTSPSFSFNAMNSRLTTHYSQGAAIHTNSWGDDGTTAYTGLARSIDTFSHDNDDNLVIFAVTNLSNLRSPENAKNVLAVGATQDANNQGAFCTGGAGPTADGRIKPEIFAPGCNTQSSQVNTTCSTTGLTGTSMAAPAIAGTAALVRQYFDDGYYPSGMAESDDGFIPSGSLIKATLLNSSVNMTGIAGFPSNQEGWGRVLLDNALYFPGDDSTLIVRDVRNAADDALETGDQHEMQVVNNDLSEPMKITLVWHDAPAAPGSSYTPVNNLDLEVVMPGGQTILGNNIVNGQSTFDTDADEINNVEMVMLPAALEGEYTVRVKGTAVNQGPQGYALVITGAVSESAACPADLNDDGLLDFFDISAFLAAFSDQDPAADFNDDGLIDFFDISGFLNAFNAGCP
ncbi:MAG: S8 family serine peptidase [Phycisphaerales bacterium]